MHRMWKNCLHTTWHECSLNIYKYVQNGTHSQRTVNKYLVRFMIKQLVFVLQEVKLSGNINSLPPHDHYGVTKLGEYRFFGSIINICMIMH